MHGKTKRPCPFPTVLGTAPPDDRGRIARRPDGGLTSVALLQGLVRANAGHAKRSKTRHNKPSYDLALLLFACSRARPQSPKQGGAYEAPHDSNSPPTSERPVGLSGKRSVAPGSFLAEGLRALLGHSGCENYVTCMKGGEPGLRPGQSCPQAPVPKPELPPKGQGRGSAPSLPASHTLSPLPFLWGTRPPGKGKGPKGGLRDRRRPGRRSSRQRPGS